MKKTIETGKTLLVNGSASVKVLSGKAEVFGYIIKENQQIIVREGKRQPFLVLENAEFHISLGANATVQEIETPTIPTSWNEAFQTVISIQNKPAVIMVIGKVDSGKSSFGTYLVNKLVDEKNKVAILDSDLEQSDIGPPCTVAYGYAVKKITELCEVKMSNAFFVGVTSPVKAIVRTNDGIVTMYKELMQKTEVNYVIVNTDGWVEGENAINHKIQLIDQLKPDIIIVIQNQEELRLLLSSINNVPIYNIESSTAVNERVSEKRIKMRELNYAKYLKEAKIRSLFSSYMKIQEKSVLPKEQGKEKGILVGLLDAKDHFLGIGIMLEYNRDRRVIKVLTPVCVKPASIAIGRIKIDPDLKELPL